MKKILWISEAPYINTGYAVYTKNVLEYLSSTGKYEIVQLGVYASEGDPRNEQFSWTIVPNQPGEGSKQSQEYKANELNQFGSWKFEALCAKFKPDIVCNISDFWMFEFIFRSPYLKYYNTAIMPTCDSEPQPKQWVDVYSRMDAILAYNDWSKEELKKRLGALSHKVIGSAPPVANSSFTPKNRLALREQMGIGPYETIFGTVMRNQRRKLFPELFKGFRRYLDNGGDGRLICHTSFPDKGWDLQALLKRNNLSNEVLFTYKCLSCDSFSLNSFKSLIKECPKCRKVSCKLCNVDDGLSTDQLSALYNVMDLYIQPCTNEGFGMPIVEAAACGTPVAVTNYSAPADIVQKLNGYPLEYTEFTNADDSLHKAIVSPKAISNLMMEFYKTPQEMRNKKRFETRQLFEKYYSSWEKTGQIWESVLDSLPYGRWNLPSCEKPINTTLPKLDSAYDISLYIIKDILKEKDMLYTLQHARLIRDLSFGFVKKTLGGEYDHETTSMQMQHEKLSPQELANVFANKRLLINNCERLRLS